MSNPIPGAAYAETLEETPGLARERERAVFGRAIDLLRQAETHGRQSRAAVDALIYLNRLWSVLIEDLASPENDLPQPLRADLISIGLWVMRQADQIRLEQSEDFSGMIEVMRSLVDGLGENQHAHFPAGR